MLYWICTVLIVILTVICVIFATGVVFEIKRQYKGETEHGVSMEPMGPITWAVLLLILGLLSLVAGFQGVLLWTYLASWILLLLLWGSVFIVLWRLQPSQLDTTDS